MFFFLSYFFFSLGAWLTLAHLCTYLTYIHPYRIYEKSLEAFYVYNYLQPCVSCSRRRGETDLRTQQTQLRHNDLRSAQWKCFSMWIVKKMSNILNFPVFYIQGFWDERDKFGPNEDRSTRWYQTEPNYPHVMKRILLKMYEKISLITMSALINSGGTTSVTLDKAPTNQRRAAGRVSGLVWEDVDVYRERGRLHNAPFYF